VETNVTLQGPGPRPHDHRTHRFGGGPPHRRFLAHRGCAPHGRLARLRVIPPLSLIGPVISIRRYGKRILSTEDLLKNETFTTGMLDFMSGCVEARLNIVISGGSGSGKTTMLNTPLAFHSRGGAHRHHRRHRRTAIAAGPRGAPGNTPPQHRRRRAITQRDLVIQYPPHAPRPHHRGRIPRPRSARHAAGHEHRPRRFHDHGARQIRRPTPSRVWKPWS